MVPEQATARARIAALVDSLPNEALDDVVSFLEFQRYKLEHRAANPTRPVPVKLGGIWSGANITDEDIQAVREEMWGNIEDRFE